MYISMDDLEMKCWDCQGGGKVTGDDGITAPCPKCEGKGVIATSLGQTLLAFVKKHLNDA